MASSLKFFTVILIFGALLGCTDALNNTNSTGTHEVSAVALDNHSAFGVCVYPRSVGIYRDTVIYQRQADWSRAPTRSLVACSTTAPSSSPSSRAHTYGL